jgi:polar amino acid transport system substrate-binding protein
MNPLFLIRRRRLQSGLALTVLASLCMAAYADNAMERARKNGMLVVGMSQVAPAYTAGAKFRTPENIDSALAEDIARQMKLRLTAVLVLWKDSAAALVSRKADIVLAAVSDTDSPHRLVATVATGYSVGPMAIMRSDTDIKKWEQLKGRKVCVSRDGRYEGTIAAGYGAVEKVFRAPADSLLALRTGKCDAAVHDSTMLEQLIKMPEWKKFSATLPARKMSSLVFAVPADDKVTLTALGRIVNHWSSIGHLKQLTEKMARNTAFEVYLDQNVPDCH